MKSIYFIFSLLSFFGIEVSQSTQEVYTISQNKPCVVGEAITFKINTNGNPIPTAAWDFGDGSGLGRYQAVDSKTYSYSKPGVYRIFVRIRGEEIPISISHTVIKPLTVVRPNHSSTIVLDSINKHLWVVNTDNNSITCINASSYQKLFEAAVGKKPRTIAIDKFGNAWVTNEEDATLTVVDKTGKPFKTIALPYGSQPYGICFDPQKDFVYVTLQATNELLQLNTNGEIRKKIHVGKTPKGLAITSDGKRVLVTRFISPARQGEVYSVEVNTFNISNTIPLAFDTIPDFEDRGRGVPNYLSSITISPDGKSAWIPSKKDNVDRGLFRDGQVLGFDNTVRTIVSQIDLASSKETIDRLDINDSDMACAVEFSIYGNLAFIAVQGNNKVHVVDAYNNSRIGTITNTGLAPQGMVFSEDGNQLFVHNFLSRSVQVYDVKQIVYSNSFDFPLLSTIKTVSFEALTSQVLLGKQIFYNAEDPRMSKAGYISCASCHLDGHSDGRVWDFTDRGEGFRNTHSLLGRKGNGMGNVHWTGNFDEIQDFENDIRNGFGGKGFMSDELFSSGTVNDPLGDKKKGLSAELDAIAAYVSSLDKVNHSPFRNADGSLSEDGLAGKGIFVNLNCGSCHSGNDFTDRSEKIIFHNVGTIQPSSGKRRNLPLTGFATPTLKGIWETSPYLHDGSAADLKEVFTLRNKANLHGNTSSLSERELDQLVSYLLQIDENEVQNTTALVDEISKGESSNLQISPNPAVDNLTVAYKISNQRKNSQLNIYTIQGQLVYSKILSTTQPVATLIIDIKGLGKGLYLVTLIEDQKRTTRKLEI
ncbi:MAG TPA: T9SS type A sorting domain-containing protein [Cytophagaceae bacterium]|jgi:DNA-binding beta-propeller fold protein YncE